MVDICAVQYTPTARSWHKNYRTHQSIYVVTVHMPGVLQQHQPILYTVAFNSCVQQLSGHLSGTHKANRDCMKLHAETIVLATGEFIQKESNNWFNIIAPTFVKGINHQNQCPQPAGLTYSHLQVYLQSRPGIG